MSTKSETVGTTSEKIGAFNVTKDGKGVQGSIDSTKPFVFGKGNYRTQVLQTASRCDINTLREAYKDEPLSMVAPSVEKVDPSWD